MNQMLLLPEDTLIPMTPESLREALGGHVLAVSFTKLNGVLRLMRCSTHHSAIPEASRPSPKVAMIDESTGATVPPKKQDPLLFTVWDLDLQAWRTFKYDRILSVTLNTQEKIESLPI